MMKFESAEFVGHQDDPKKIMNKSMRAVTQVLRKTFAKGFENKDQPQQAGTVKDHCD